MKKKDKFDPISEDIRISDLAEDLTKLVEKYKDLPAYEVGHEFIYQAVYLMLHTAPNELLAMKTILQCIYSGIMGYEEVKDEENKP